MKRPVLATLPLLGLLLAPLAASAAPVKAYVSEFNIVSASGENKIPLKTLLQSRLSGEEITAVDAPSEADVVISGSMTQIGKIFSLDAVVKSSAGKQLGTAFEQGESPDGVIPSVGKMASKLKDEILKGYRPAAAAAAPAVPPASLPAAVAVAPAAAPSSAQSAAPAAASPSFVSQRLVGAHFSIALAGKDQLLTAQGKKVRLYQKGKELNLLAEAEVSPQQKIVGIDTSLDSQGRTLAFVSIVQSEAACSRIYLVEAKRLTLLAQEVPYLFRSVSASGGEKKLYAQELARGGEFYGDVFEASFDGKGTKLSNPIKMPRFANIFNFNSFRDQSGKSYLVSFSESGYLIVYSDQGEELWRSEEKFGGSESYFLRRDPDNERFFSAPAAPRFLDQRISVTRRGEILVPQNDGFFVVGNSRSYSKYSMVALAWNGSSLEERWRSKQVKNYLSDYHYDGDSNEVYLLEVTQSEGVISKGASVVKVITPELP